MRTRKQYLDYIELEFMGQNPTPTWRNYSPQQVAQRLWQRMREFWKIDADPRVQELVDDAGRVYWQVDDLLNNRSIQFKTEEQMLEWLEARYYNRSRQIGWGNTEPCAF